MIREGISSCAWYGLGKTRFSAARWWLYERYGSGGLAKEWARTGWSWAMVMGRGQAGLAVQEEQANVLAARMEE
jgi:hypothetical protein